MSCCLSTGRARRRETSLSGLRALREGRQGTLMSHTYTYSIPWYILHCIYTHYMHTMCSMWLPAEGKVVDIGEGMAMRI